MENRVSVEFSRMTDDEFRIFSKWSVRNYAKHLIKSGAQECYVKAFLSSKAEFRDVFPEGSKTSDNYLYVVKNYNNEKIGVIGYQKSPFEDNAAFVIENVIKEEFRGKGYGKSALIKLQEDAKQKGFPKMVLNAFKYNTISFNMYEKCGFVVIEDFDDSVIMEKYL